MNQREIDNKVNDWIDGLRDLPDDEYILVLETMIDYAQTALDARREEAGDNER